MNEKAIEFNYSWSVYVLHSSDLLAWVHSKSNQGFYFSGTLVNLIHLSDHYVNIAKTLRYIMVHSKLESEIKIGSWLCLFTIFSLPFGLVMQSMCKFISQAVVILVIFFNW